MPAGPHAATPSGRGARRPGRPGQRGVEPDDVGHGVRGLDAGGGRLTPADLVVTGEGTFDATSLTGKAVSGVAALAA
ncbi:MAG TPA: glycerate kinase, partial [Mycobacteriales bacterium]|nr:glycerate kinase [Mycobacteriales bacterium]